MGARRRTVRFALLLTAFALGLWAPPAEAAEKGDAYGEYAQRARGMTPEGEVALWIYFLRLHPQNPQAQRVRRRLAVLESVLAQRKGIVEDVESLADWREAAASEEPAAEAAGARALLEADIGPFEEEVRARERWLAPRKEKVPLPWPTPTPAPPVPAATPPFVAIAPSVPPRPVPSPTPVHTGHPNAPLPAPTPPGWVVPGLSREPAPTPSPTPTVLALAPTDPQESEGTCAAAYARLASAQESLGACLRLGGSCDAALAGVAAARAAVEPCGPPPAVPVDEEPAPPRSTALALAPTPPVPDQPEEPAHASACDDVVSHVEGARAQVASCIAVSGSDACGSEFEQLENAWAARSACEAGTVAGEPATRESVPDFAHWKTAVAALPLDERPTAWRVFVKLAPDSPHLEEARREVARAEFARIEEEKAREEQRRAEAQEKRQAGQEQCIGLGAGGAAVLLLLLLL